MEKRKLVEEVRRLAILTLVSGLLAFAPAWAGDPLVAGGSHTYEDHSGHDHAGETLVAIDLTGSDLSGASLCNTDLTDTVLLFADLDGTDTRDPDQNPCVTTTFAAADLGWASLRDGFFPGNLFTGGAILYAADLTRADLTGADFATNGAAELRRADLSGATFDAADLTGVDLVSAVADCVVDPAAPETPRCVSFAGATLDGAQLDYAELESPVLRSATTDASTSFFAARLRGANLAGVAFAGVNLEQVDLAGATLTESKVEPTDLALVADFSSAILLDATLATGGLVAPCTTPLEGESAQCVSFAGAELAGVRMRAVDFAAIDLDFQLVAPAGGPNLGEADFAGSDFYDVGPDGNPGTGDDYTAALSGADLHQAVLSSTDLTRAVVSGGADLTRADLTGATLVQAVFDGSDLRGAILDGVTLCDATACASFTGAVLEASGGLAGASLQGVDFTSLPTAAKLSDLGITSLASLDLDDSNLSGVDLTGITDLSGASLRAANLSGVDLAGRDLGDADLSGATLSGADIGGATLTGAILDDVALCGTTCVLNLDTAILAGGSGTAGVRMRRIDFRSITTVPHPLTGLNLASTDLRESIFDGLDLTATDFAGGDIGSASLRNTTLTDAVFTDATLAGAVFSGAEFAQGASGDQTGCTPAQGTSPVDLIGANLIGADFASALHFAQGCIAVDGTTTYSADTKFPDGFSTRLLRTMTFVPEPSAGLLQLGALVALVRLRRRRSES